MIPLGPMRTSGLVLSLSFLLVACGGGDDDGAAIDAGAPDAAPPENAGFVPPDVTTTAYQPDGTSWTEVGPADWSCLGTPTGDEPTTVEVTITGEVLSRNSPGDTVPGAEITAWSGNDVSATPIATATADAEALYSLTLPVGTTRVAYRATAPDFVDTYLLNQYYEPATAEQTETQEPVSGERADILLALINKSRVPGQGILAAAIRDCQGHEVAGAIATVSTVSGAVDHADGADTYYFSATATSVPVQHGGQKATNKDGRFMVIGVDPADEIFIQVWGFLADQDPATDELTLIAELAAPSIADALVTASLEARRTE